MTDDNRTHRVTLADTGECFPCRSDMAVLKAMTTLGYRGITSGCHGGGCGVCKVRVDEGDYIAGVMSRAHVSEDDENRGIVLACRIQPQGDLRLTVVGALGRTLARQKRKFGLV
jgi:ferredoxin